MFTWFSQGSGAPEICGYPEDIVYHRVEELVIKNWAAIMEKRVDVKSKMALNSPAKVPHNFH